MWEVLNQRVIHDAYPWVRLSCEHVRLPNAVEIPDFYRVDISPYVMMFVQTREQQVVMIEHYKHGPQQMSLELPAGYIEPQTTPLDTAKRELREETGYASNNWQALGKQFIDGNRGCGAVYAFLARDAYLVGQPQREETEIMTLRLLSLNEVFERWQAGGVQNVASMSIIGQSLLALGYLVKANG